MQTRRSQKPITIRSDRAAATLAILTRNGRSQAEIIEEALDRLSEPPPPIDQSGFLKRIAEIQARYAREDHRFRSMAEFDAAEYDANGNPR